MKAISHCFLTILLIAAFACSKNELTVGPNVTSTPVPSMTGGWGITWLGWYANYSGTITGTMTLTEKDSTLSGSISLRGQTFNVAGHVSSAYQVILSGADGSYEYAIIGTVSASKTALDSKIIVSHMGTVPPDTAGSAIMNATKYK
jgi:hypothetical protein